jgi:vancomycin resistance protein YoaR
MRLVGFAAAFIGGAIATLVLLSAVAFSFAGSYNNRVVPGVHVGSVDLSGDTRDEAIAKLQAGYSYLSKGEVTVTTPAGSTTITYGQLNRGPDVDVMADTALSLGHTGNPMADAASVIHSALFGQDIPVVIRIDPTALAQRVHDLVSASLVPAQNAQASSKSGAFAVTQSAEGTGLEEDKIGASILNQLTQANAPVDLQAGGSFVALKPQVSDSDAQQAITQAKKMVVGFKLTWTTPPNPLPAKWVPRTWTVTADQVSGWIIFGVRQDGTYAPAVDPAQIQAYLVGISNKANLQATAPHAVYTAAGKPSALDIGNNGVGIDLNATTNAISAYLDSVANGGKTQDSIEVSTGAINPQISSATDVSKYVVIGTWSVVFFPGPANGNGANIRVPATNLNGQVVGPGQEFSFLNRVGTIDAAHGFQMGGVIIGGHSNHTGAMGGGICSASTTMFNAAAMAGLQIDERHPHYYFISRYPIGRDATVYSNGSNTWDLRWTNDTPNPILIRSWTTYSKSHITIQLWSLPLNRTVTWTGDTKAAETKPMKATQNPPEYVTTMKPGVTYAAEITTDGFSTLVTRVVKDSSGKVIHDDTWASTYSPVNGQLQIGGTPPPPATPTPKPSPTPSPTAVVFGVPVMLLRRRRRVSL